MFGKLKDKLRGATTNLNGKTDLLECGGAIVALTTFADGNADDSEVMTALELMTGHDTLSKAFRQSEIEACVNKMMDKAKGGIASRVKLMREIEEAAGNNSRDDLEMMFLIGLDVASADGDVGQKETEVLNKIGRALGGFQVRDYADA